MSQAEELAVVEFLERYQQLSVDVLERHGTDPEAAVKALVSLHLAWTEEDPERALLVGRSRNAAAAGAHGERLAESNREWFGQVKAWVNSQAEAGRLEPVSFNLLHAVLFAPTQEICRLWLAGRLKRPLSEYAEPLGEAAWSAVESLPAVGEAVSTPSPDA